MGAVAVNSDITREKQAEQAVRESEERYRAFVQNSSEAIWRFELDKPVPVALPEDAQIEWLYRHGYMAECNQVMARMFGYASPEEMRGVRLGSILPRTGKNIEFLRAFVRSGYRLVEAESEDLDKHGNVKHALSNIVGVVKDGFGIHAWGTTATSPNARRRNWDRQISPRLLNPRRMSSSARIWITGSPVGTRPRAGCSATPRPRRWAGP